MMSIEDKSVLDEYIQKHEGMPPAYNVIDGQAIYEFQDDFG
jgi:hypothetical protein